jgi:hypothetical protein
MNKTGKIIPNIVLFYFLSHLINTVIFMLVFYPALGIPYKRLFMDIRNIVAAQTFMVVIASIMLLKVLSHITPILRMLDSGETLTYEELQKVFTEEKRYKRFVFIVNNIFYIARRLSLRSSSAPCKGLSSRPASALGIAGADGIDACDHPEHLRRHAIP